MLSLIKSREDLPNVLKRLSMIMVIDDKISEPLVRRFYSDFVPYRANLTWTQFLSFLMKTYNKNDIKPRLNNFWSNNPDTDFEYKDGLSDSIQKISFLGYLYDNQADVIKKGIMHRLSNPIKISQLPQLMQLIISYLDY